jgi:hypothetical protein
MKVDAAATCVAAVVARLVAMCTGHANKAVLVKHAAAFCTYCHYDALKKLLLLLLLQVDTLDDAIAMVNANPYGNGTAIFTDSGSAARKFQHDVQV